MTYACVCWLTHAASLTLPAVLPAEKTVPCRVVEVLAGTADAALRLPTDVAVDASGRVYVADGVNDRLVRFDPGGGPTLSLKRCGGLALANPLAVTIDSDQRLWIADNGSHRVLVARPDEEAGEVVELPAGPDGGAADPTDVAVTADRRWAYIVDNDHHRLLVRDNASGQITILGTAGEARGQLQWPFMAAMCADGELLITEAIGARVQRLDAQQRWIGQISRWGVHSGELYRPKGIAVDGQNRVFVGDSTSGTIQVFHRRGRFLGVLVDGAGRIQRFDHPMGMCFDARGRLLVVELRAQRVAVVEADAPAEQTGAEP
jgi:DNA-binding beta-propeller fold protein YncE